MHSFFFAFTFQIHIHIHIFTSEVTCYFCYFCYRLTILLPFYLFTFLPLNASRRSRCYIATQSFVRPDVAIATSGRSFRCIGRGKKYRKFRLQSRETHFQIRQISSCRIRDC